MPNTEVTQHKKDCLPTISVQVEVAGVFIDYSGISKNACKYLSCPFKADAPNKFTIEITTLDWLPPVSGAELACTEADIAIIGA
uniref:MD-2-related lipid-recognition domain-containing protein n=1 Tax=Tetranychus urticae TaxID=32264 RepID=T1JQB8_TETUR